MFVLHSDITIGNFRISGVNHVHITKSVHSIADSAIITLPSLARIAKDGKAVAEDLITGKQIKEGDAVTILLGYDNDLRQEFKGFVSHVKFDRPLEIECEGYCWLLRRNNIRTLALVRTIKDMLLCAVAGLDGGRSIQVRCDVDIKVSGVQTKNISGFDLINYIGKMTDGCLCCYFVEPDVLWCGLLYTAIASGHKRPVNGTVSYRLGLNALDSNTLKEQATNNAKAVRYYKRMPDGKLLSATSDVYGGDNPGYTKVLNQITDERTLKLLANEKAYRLSYKGYSGNLEGFIRPFATPGYSAFISDARYPERDDAYLVEGTAVDFGVKGARRKIDAGPQINF